MTGRPLSDFSQRADIRLIYEAQRSARRQRLAKHLHKCGVRPVLEALIAVEGGQPLDTVLEDFARLSPEIYEAVGADVMPIDAVAVIAGGRR
jgi:hypothetical protein